MQMHSDSPSLPEELFLTQLPGNPRVDDSSVEFTESISSSLSLARMTFSNDVQMPAWSNLRVLHLQEIQIGRQFFHILMSADKLAKLIVEDLMLDYRDLQNTSLADFMNLPDLQNHDMRLYPELDDESEIVLSSLTELRLSGKRTPAFWQHHVHFAVASRY